MRLFEEMVNNYFDEKEECNRFMKTNIRFKVKRTQCEKAENLNDKMYYTSHDVFRNGINNLGAGYIIR